MVKRCESTNMDLCYQNPMNPCCNKYQIDRFYPIGPYVQPTLAENWVSAFFEFTGQNPLAVVWLKTMVIAAFVSFITIFWTLLGQYVGFIPKSAQEFHKERRDLLDNLILEVEKSENWLEKLAETSSETQAWRGVKRFACCLSENKVFKCTKPFKKGRIKEKEATFAKLGCLYDLVYDINLNTKDQDKKNEKNIV